MHTCGASFRLPFLTPRWSPHSDLIIPTSVFTERKRRVPALLPAQAVRAGWAMGCRHYPQEHVVHPTWLCLATQLVEPCGNPLIRKMDFCEVALG